ncbi:amidase family protein [Burkholderia gladioli]|uniref:amidase family protein n=1 Tax=Burkholderia gladioli TaxID=28095 RepID=UPI002FE0DCCC
MSDIVDPSNGASELHARKFASLGVAAAAGAIKRGEMTSEAYASALLQQADAHADLHAFTTIDNNSVLEAARSADKARSNGAQAPLLGVPIGVKDSYLTAGLPTTIGLDSLSSFVPQEDADAVQAIKEAGAIVFGKNNLVEMSYGLTGHNERYGQVKNPRAKDRVTGGSSSGSAAAVAAGIVPASLGGDTVGSIRVPASLCGVVGFKPTTGRWPRKGVAPISHTLDTTGLFTRNVEDCILIDRVMTGRPHSDPIDNNSNLKGVRLAFAARQFLGFVDREVEHQFREVLRRLRDHGAEIVEIDLGEDFNALVQTTTWGIFAHETQASISEFLSLHKVPTTFDAIYAGLKPRLRQSWDLIVLPDGAGATSVEAYQAALNVGRPEIQRRLDQALVTYGVHALIQPTTPCPAPLIDAQWAFQIAYREVSDLALANHTLMASSVGLPGISLPSGLSSAGLPLAIELDGAIGSDPKLLELARKVTSLLRA